MVLVNNQSTIIWWQLPFGVNELSIITEKYRESENLAIKSTCCIRFGIQGLNKGAYTGSARQIPYKLICWEGGK
jgi:hypothetical protein